MTRRKHFQNPAPADRDGPLWLYGAHTVRAALANPTRASRRLLATAEAARSLVAPRISVEIVDRARIEEVLPPGSVHQGLALLADPLPAVSVEDIAFSADPRSVAIVLDQVTDPQNVGAVLRAGAAFGAAAVIVHDRHAPPATGALAKAASGALETVPLVRATNIVRALGTFKEAGFWCAGLAAEADGTLQGTPFSPRAVLVLGAEGEGLRRLTRETCDMLLRIPTQGAMASLNVATAAAIALYEFTRGR